MTFGMLGVAAITGVTYALTAGFDSADADSVLEDSESKEALTSFERFAAEHFLTDFESKRSFDNVKNSKFSRDKKNRKSRRKRRNAQNRVKSSKFYQPSENYFMYRTSRTL